VIEHGGVEPQVRYTGELARGLVVVNNLGSRGRRLGADLFARAREEVPLDLVGMGAESLGGLGEVPHQELPAFAARYRFFFNPIRYTSLGLAVCEAMMLGMPLVGLATTEMVTVVESGVSGYLDTDLTNVITHMQELLRDPDAARCLGEGARRRAEARFSIQRFARDWEDALAEWVCQSSIQGGHDGHDQEYEQEHDRKEDRHHQRARLAAGRLGRGG
jgi:glycosyltransferase involved in cell wall biosynthesis